MPTVIPSLVRRDLRLLLAHAFGLRALLGQAEVHHLHMPFRREHDVRGLQITMDDALLVRLVERLGDFQADLQGVLLPEGALREHLLERLPFDLLHDDVAGVADLEELADAADVGMIECRGELRFPKQPLPRGLVLSNALGQDFDGHLVARRRVRR